MDIYGQKTVFLLIWLLLFLKDEHEFLNQYLVPYETNKEKEKKK